VTDGQRQTVFQIVSQAIVVFMNYQTVFYDKHKFLSLRLLSIYGDLC
jgi:hypothetical protein